MSEETKLAQIKVLDKLSIPDRMKQREAIVEMENLMLQMPDQLEIPVNHLIHGGCYARAVTVPAGTMLTGQIYKFDHIEIMAHGTIVVTTDDGSSRVLKGFNLMPALTGKKRAAYAIEETTWITVHAVGNTGQADGDEVHSHLTVEDFDELDGFYGELNRRDFADFVRALGMNADDYFMLTNNPDAINLDFEQFGITKQPSHVVGEGVFANHLIVQGEFIIPAKMKGVPTNAGLLVSHAVRPNARLLDDGTDLNIVAIRNISAGEEITINYRDVTITGDQL